MMKEISLDDLKKLRKKSSTVIVDIREPEEFMEDNIGGMNIPSHLLNDHIEELRKYKSIIVLCSNGLRSNIIARVLSQKIPTSNIFHLTNGIYPN